MRLPNHNEAIVPRKKIIQYLLSADHEVGRSKAEFFTRYGFTSDEWAVFAEALRSHAAEHEVEKTVSSSYGLRYIVVGELDTPSGSRPMVKVVWFIENGETRPRLVTAYPAKRPE